MSRFRENCMDVVNSIDYRNNDRRKNIKTSVIRKDGGKPYAFENVERVKRILTFIDYLNNIDEDDKDVILKKQQDEFMVPDWFAKLITPSEIYFDPSSNVKIRLMVRDDVDCPYIRYDEFKDDLDFLSNVLTFGKSFNMVKFTDLRKVASLYDIIGSIIDNENRVSYGFNDEYFVPVKLNAKISTVFVKPRFFNVTYDEYMKEYIQRCLIPAMRSSLN